MSISPSIQISPLGSRACRQSLIGRRRKPKSRADFALALLARISTLRWRDLECRDLSAAQCVHRDRLVDPLAIEESDQIVNAGHGFTVEADNDVAWHELRHRGGTAILDRGDHCTELVRDAGGNGETPWHRNRLRRYADKGAAHAAVSEHIHE